MSELFWGLSHWEWHQWVYAKDGVRLTLGGWRRLWDQEFLRKHQEAGEALEANGWVLLMPYYMT